MTYRSRFSALAATLALAFAAACGGDDGGTGPSGNETRLDITNNSNVSVFLVFVRDCGTQNWGNDLLGADVIPAGLGQSFIVTPGCHDVRLETSPFNAGEIVWSNVNFPAGQVTARTVTTWNPAN